MTNTGTQGVVLRVQDALHAAEPWHFTIGAGDSHSYADWQGADAQGRYDLVLHGPNGFLRRYAGASEDRLDVLLHERPEMEAVELVFFNRGKAPAICSVALDLADAGNGARMRHVTIAPGAEVRDLWRVGKSDRWYDLAVTLGKQPHVARRFAGKVETGAHGKTDPAIGVMRLTA
jgi:phospholipase C